MATRIAEPGYVVQRRATFNGEDYEPGDPAPSDLGNTKRLVRLGIIAAVPGVVVASMDTQANTWDPASGTVEEALRFVMAHPDQLDRVREAEESGQGRTTLLEALDAGVELPEPTPGRLPIPGDPFAPSTTLRAHAALMADQEGSVDAAVVEAEELEDLDPAEHPVAVVIGWADSRPDQAGVILERERDGKNRTTLVTHLERLVSEQA